jgi:hypothetical protein
MTQQLPLPPDPTEHLTKASTRPEQDEWRDDDYLGYIRIKRVSTTGLAYDLTAEDIPFLKPSDRLQLLVIGEVAKLRTSGFFYVAKPIYGRLYGEFGQELDMIKGGISIKAYKAYRDSNPELIRTAKEHIRRKKNEETRQTKTRLIYKRGPWDVGSSLLITKIAEAIEGIDVETIDIEPFLLREGDPGYNPSKPRPNGRGYIFAPGPVADQIVKAAAEGKIVVNGVTKPKPFVLSVVPFPKK